MNTSDLLASIEMKAKFVEYYAKELGEKCAMLAYRRPFLTKAEAAMEESEKSLVEALRVVRLCRQVYSDKEASLA